jgi:hypothetical protein
LANSDGGTCTSPFTETLYWSISLSFDTGTALFTDPGLTTCWTNVMGYNVMSLGAGSYEYYKGGGGGCTEVGASNGIQC